MNNRSKTALGALMGVLVMIFAFRHFLYSYKDGNPKWFMLVMVCGMLLILYYSIIGNRRRKEDEYDDEDYS